MVTSERVYNWITFAFRVRAVNAEGEGPWSSVSDKVTPIPPATAPEAPSNLLATAEDSQVTLSWEVAGNGGVELIRHEYQVRDDSQSGNDYGDWVEIANSGAGGDNINGFTVTSLTNENPYSFRVRAINRAVDSPGLGPGAASNEATAIPATTPEAPIDLAALTGNGELSLSWTLGANGGSALTGHEYQVKEGSGGYEDWAEIPDSAPATGDSPAGANATSFTLSGLTNGTTYKIKVRALNAMGHSSPSNEVSLHPEGLPLAPLDLVVNPGDTEVRLIWTVASDGGSEILRHEYKQKKASEAYGDWTPIIHSGLGQSHAGLFTLIGLENGVVYRFKLRAVNAQGDGPSSQESSTTPTPAVTTPEAPTHFRVTRGNNTED